MAWRWVRQTSPSPAVAGRLPWGFRVPGRLLDSELGQRPAAPCMSTIRRFLRCRLFDKGNTAMASPREAQFLPDRRPGLVPARDSASVDPMVSRLGNRAGLAAGSLPTGRVLSSCHFKFDIRNSLTMVAVGRPRDGATQPLARRRGRSAQPPLIGAAAPKRVHHGQQNVNRCLTPGRDPGGGITR
jgi:hypothetical protein